MALPVEISAWKPAPFALNGETVFAIGDIHGCAAELAVLLQSIQGLAREAKGKRRLIYLGDMDVQQTKARSGGSVSGEYKNAALHVLGGGVVWRF